MPIFDAKVRSIYTDIGGLILDCSADNAELDDSDKVEVWTNQAPVVPAVFTGTHTGGIGDADLNDTTQWWIIDNLVGRYVHNITDGSWGRIESNNETNLVAPLSGGIENFWDTDDEYEIGIPRYDDLTQTNSSYRPGLTTLSGETFVSFVSTSNHFFNIPLTNMDYPPTNMTVAFDANFPTPAGNDWTVCKFGGTQALKIYAYDNGSSTRGWVTGATTVSTTGNMTTGTWIINNEDIQDGQAWKDGAEDSGLDGDLFFSEKSTGTSVGVLGCEASGTDHMDGALRRFSIWQKELSDREIALIDDCYGVSAAGTLYADIVAKEWFDETGGPDQPSRLNPKRGIAQKFLTARVPATGAYVQIAAEIGGVSLPDSALEGELFVLDCIEYPKGPPGIYSDSGWSSVYDVYLFDEGHYTFVLARQYAGSVVVHLDVERP
jgi:hypothetical protein